MQDNFALLSLVAGRFKEPEVQRRLKGFSKSMQIRLTDVNEEYLFIIENGRKVTLQRGGIESPEILITTTSKTLSRIISKSINPASAYFSKKIKVMASLDDMLKLREILS